MNEENRKIDKKPFEDNLSVKGEHKKSLKGEGRSSYSRITDKHVYAPEGEGLQPAISVQSFVLCAGLAVS